MELTFRYIVFDAGEKKIARYQQYFLYKDKEFGHILDYRGVLEDLNNALNVYAALPEFEREDLDAYNYALVDIGNEVAKLAQRHADIWDLFKGLSNKYDEEAYEILLADPVLRNIFYERLTVFSKTLAIALSCEDFYRETEQRKIDLYQHDLRFFTHLRASIRLRYAERIDFRQYEPRIQKLIDRYVGAGTVEQITELVDIFDEKAFAREVARVTGGDAAKADTIAHRAWRTCIEHMQEDPAFYRKFSEILEEAIKAFREERIKAAEYLLKVKEIVRQIVHRTDEDIPPAIRRHDLAKAYFGCTNGIIAPLCAEKCDPAEVGTAAAIAIDDIITSLRIVNWTSNTDIQNRMRIRIEDVLYELKDRYGLGLDFDQMDEIAEQCLNVAKVRLP